MQICISYANVYFLKAAQLGQLTLTNAKHAICMKKVYKGFTEAFAVDFGYASDSTQIK